MFSTQQILTDNWQQLHEVATKYNSQDGLAPYYSQINNFVMKVPLVGLFSAGKSSLLNKILDDNLLSVQITPETAIATELHYSDEKEAFYGHKANGETVKLTRNDIENQNFEAFLGADTKDAYGWVSTHTKSPILKNFPHLCLVDLPGLESNFTSHERMIDDYIQQSLAYCIVVSIEDGELKASTQKFLQELKINNTPIILIITKSDVKHSDDTKAIAKKIEDSITHLLGTPPLKTVIVSARKKDNLDGVIDAFSAIENQAGHRFNKVVTLPFMSKLAFITQNLDKLLDMDDVTIEQLESDKQIRQQEIALFREKLAKDTDQLETKTISIINNIVSNTKNTLIAQLDNLTDAFIQKRNISETIGSIVRLAVTEGVQTELLPVVNKYIKHIESELPDSLQINSEDINIGDISDDGFSFTDIASVLAPVLALLKFNPIVAIISTIVIPVLAKMLDMFMSNSKKEQQLEKQKENARQVILAQVIPRIELEVRSAMTTVVHDNIAKARSMMEQIADEREQQVQAQIAQTEKDIKAGEAEQQKRKTEYAADKNYISDVISQLSQAQSAS